MIKINLLGEVLAQAAGKKVDKGELAPVYAQEGTRSSFPIAGVISGLLLASIGGIYYISLTGKVETETRRNADLQRQKTELQKYFKLEEEYRQKKESIEKKKEVLVSLRVAQRMPVHLMEELANSLPDEVWFDELSQKGRVITVKGKGASFEAINLFQTHLQERSTWFEKVNWPGATKKGNSFEFSISFELKTPLKA
jgi:Tfp pilus assembly protein PilN